MQTDHTDISLKSQPSPPFHAVKETIPGKRLDNAKEGVKQGVAKKYVKPNSPVMQKNVKDSINQNVSEDNVKQDNQKADYASLDIRQRKTVCNKPNRELRFMSEEVEFFSIFYLSLFQCFLDTWSAQVYSSCP